jgi:hypothetical protein
VVPQVRGTVTAGRGPCDCLTLPFRAAAQHAAAALVAAAVAAAAAAALVAAAVAAAAAFVAAAVAAASAAAVIRAAPGRPLPQVALQLLLLLLLLSLLQQQPLLPCSLPYDAPGDDHCHLQMLLLLLLLLQLLLAHPHVPAVPSGPSRCAFGVQTGRGLLQTGAELQPPLRRAAVEAGRVPLPQHHRCPAVVVYAQSAAGGQACQ